MGEKERGRDEEADIKRSSEGWKQNKGDIKRGG